MQWSEIIKDYTHDLDQIAINSGTAAKLIHLLDLTSLNDDDTETSIAHFCTKARTTLGDVAAVCVYPQFVHLVADEFAATPIKVATVVNFPQGIASLESTLLAIGRALQDGAQEIDVVFPYSKYLNGERAYASTFVSECKAACGENVLLKVILETGQLKDPVMIAHAATDALNAGADFLKTSTGKTNPGATLEAATVLLMIIREMNLPNKGLKISGGVREIQQAGQYVELAARMMGLEWVTPKHFRIGASQLIDNILKEVT